ncbi:hypothetical protein D3C86_1655720 [compost metagenome]
MYDGAAQPDEQAKPFVGELVTQQTAHARHNCASDTFAFPLSRLKERIQCHEQDRKALGGIVGPSPVEVFKSFEVFSVVLVIREKFVVQPSEPRVILLGKHNIVTDWRRMRVAKGCRDALAQYAISTIRLSSGEQVPLHGMLH